MTGKREDHKTDTIRNADELTSVLPRISQKRVVIRDDGRYVILYEFVGAATDDATGRRP